MEDSQDNVVYQFVHVSFFLVLYSVRQVVGVCSRDTKIVDLNMNISSR